MYGNNPYAQAGWYNPQNPHSINAGPWRPNPSHPPTFGVLPAQQDPNKSVLTFEFSSFNHQIDILNCIVTGSGQRKFFEIRTKSNVTVVSKPAESLAFIRWSHRPTMEATGAIPLQPTGDFLKLSSDQTYRTMIISGKAYAWIPRSSGIYLYSAGPNPPDQYAKISVTSDNSKALLEITSEAFQAGLFEPSIISTVLLFSSRNIN